LASVQLIQAEPKPPRAGGLGKEGQGPPSRHSKRRRPHEEVGKFAVDRAARILLQGNVL